jgi:hypothetical protein
MTRSPHPLIRSSAPPTTDRGVSFIQGDCQRCEFCWTRLYGCSATRCYCHSHPLEPGGI